MNTNNIQKHKMFAAEISVVIKELQSISGTNDKKEFLSSLLGHQELYKYLRYVYDEVNYVYGKSKLPKIDRMRGDTIPDNDLSEMYLLLDRMNDGEIKGNAADAAIQRYCEVRESFYEDLLFYIIKRDIKAKTGVKVINEVFGRIIPIAPYMRCESESYMKKRIDYTQSYIDIEGKEYSGALVETKADGAFLNMIIDPHVDTVECSTRYGRKACLPNFDHFSMISELMGFSEQYTIHGELLLLDPDGNIYPREVGNGKINGYIKRNSTYLELQTKLVKAKTNTAKKKIEDEKDSKLSEWKYISQNIVYDVWDIVNTKDWLELASPATTIERFLLIKKAVESFNKYAEDSNLQMFNNRMRLTDYRFVKDEEEAMEFYQEQLDKGLEGMVAKNLLATWVHDSNRQGIIKLKDFKENDLIIIGYNMADPDSDFAGGIGSLIMESEDGLVKVNVSGMKRDARGLERVDPNDSSKGLQVIDGFDFDQFTGKIAAVKYNELLCGNSNVYSLFLPNVLEIRERSDKVFPDSLDKIKKDAKYKGK